MMVRGLIERDRTAPRFALTDQGRAVLAALLKAGGWIMRRSAAPTITMTLGNMCAQGARSLSVSCWQRSAQRRSLAGRPSCAVVWPANGVHPLRNRRRRCAAELDGVAGAADLDGSAMALEAPRARRDRRTAHLRRGGQPQDSAARASTARAVRL